MRDSTVIDDFIGRTKELDALEGMFTPATAKSGEPPRLLTLTGVGGSGKTRLARQFSDQIRREFADGTIWVDLAPLSGPELVVREILAALDLTEQPDQSPLETLVTQLAFTQVLLVLDNCEHLLDILPALCRTLLARCPELTVLATTREPLGLVDEVIYPVLPLSLPIGDNAEAALNSDAVRLFIARARQVLPAFAVNDSNLPAIVRVCTRLDGLPLAIELAAARVKVMTVTEIAERLNNAFRLLTRGTAAIAARHQTLRAAMDWSYRLLSPAEQTLFRRASVFAGGFTLDAAERICSDPEDLLSPNVPMLRHSDILDLLSNLADKSLIVIAEHFEHTPTRYQMLEIVRQYAGGKMLAAGEQAILQARHLALCISFAEHAEPELTGARQKFWLEQLDHEQFNIRAALRYACDAGKVEAGLELANALIRFWGIRGNYSEALAWYQEMLGMELASVAPSIHAGALYGLAAFHSRQGDLERAMAVGETSLALTQQLADRSGMATTLNLLGVVATELGNFVQATEFHEHALTLRRELGDMWGIAASLHNLGYVAQQQGQYHSSFEYLEQSLELKRIVGDRAAVALTLNSIGDVAISLGDYAHAQALLYEGLEIHRELGETQGVIYDLTNLGEIAYRLGEYEQAQALYQEAEPLAHELGSKRDIAIVLSGLGDVAHAHANTARAETLYEQALALFRQVGEQVRIAKVLHSLATNAMTGKDPARSAELELAALTLFRKLDHKPGLASALEGVARICVERQQYTNAVRFLGAAFRLREEASTPAHPTERRTLEHVDDTVAAALGENAFQAGLERGRTLPLAESIDAALALSPHAVEAAVEDPVLQVLGLGKSVVLRGSEPITSAEWAYVKAKELFFYLLAHRSATKEQIGLDLWADASPTQLRRIFHRVLHALRHALGSGDWITYRDDAYILDMPGGYVYDVETFESHLADAQRLLQEGGTALPRAIASLERAVAVYQGDFLADLLGGDWILFRREQILQQYLQALLTLGRLHSEQKQYAAAVLVYEQALVHDNYFEIAHRELIRARARQGDVALALRQYQTLVELLRSEFGAPPALETRALYEKLSRGESI